MTIQELLNKIDDAVIELKNLHGKHKIIIECGMEYSDMFDHTDKVTKVSKNEYRQTHEIVYVYKYNNMPIYLDKIHYDKHVSVYMDNTKFTHVLKIINKTGK